jgi:phage-related protein
MSNLDINLNAAMNAFDGLRGAVVTVYVVPSGNLAANAAEITEVFTIIETSADNQWITFTLGYADPLGRRFPRDRYVTSACRHVFGGAFCQYAGALTTCDRTLLQCGDGGTTPSTGRNNTAHFGGSPGIDAGVYV